MQRAAREMGILTVGVVTKPFHFEGQRRMATAEAGIIELQKSVDTLIVIPNQNLFRIANDKTTFSDAFGMADQVLYSGVACITDLMVKEGLINLDFADVRSVMSEMGKAMMGTGEASGESRAMQAAEAAISNPLLDETSMRGAQGLLISITGGRDLTLFEVDEAATRIREEVDEHANIILGATFDESLEGVIRVSVVATGIDKSETQQASTSDVRMTDVIARRTMALPTKTGVAVTAGNAVAAPSLTVTTPQKNTEKVADDLRIEKTAAALDIPEPAQSVEKEGVNIEPFTPNNLDFSDPVVEEEFQAALEDELMPQSEEFVPSAAKEPDGVFQSQRIPQVKDFPPIAQAEVKAKAASNERQSEDRGPMGLLKKLKQGFGVKESEAVKPAPAEPVAPAEPIDPVMKAEKTPELPKQMAELTQELTPEPTVSQDREPQLQTNSTVSTPRRLDNNPYAPPQGQGNLDQNGRIKPPEKQFSEDDQLDIPAFLRRQAN